MKTLEQQWQDMTNIPVFELELKSGEFITVDLYNHDKGIMFEFDTMDMPCWFSGEVGTIGHGVFVYKYDEFFDSLDHYLQEIYTEMIEGFIIPNNLELAE